MDRSSTVLTIGLALDHAQQQGVRIDVATTDGRSFVGVTVAALDRFCLVLLEEEAPGARAHVVSREHVVSVSMARQDLLQIESPGHPAQAAS
jgi:hypothetical protein